MDIATAQQQRLDFARVCVEISAASELPKVIQIRNEHESVSVNIEYQWIPPKCSKCGVFGHSCKPKAEEPITGNDKVWQQVGKVLGGGGGTLEALTKVVPNAIGAAFVVHPDEEGVLLEDASSEASEELREVDQALMAKHKSTEGSSAPLTTTKLGLEVNSSSLSSLDPALQSDKEIEGHTPPDPPDDIYAGKSANKNSKAKKKKAGSGSKGGTSNSSKKGR